MANRLQYFGFGPVVVVVVGATVVVVVDVVDVVVVVPPPAPPPPELVNGVSVSVRFVVAGWPFPSVAVKVIAKVPATVGVPERVPALDNVRPVGSTDDVHVKV